MSYPHDEQGQGPGQQPHSDGAWSTPPYAPDGTPAPPVPGQPPPEGYAPQPAGAPYDQEQDAGRQQHTAAPIVRGPRQPAMGPAAWAGPPARGGVAPQPETQAPDAPWGQPQGGQPQEPGVPAWGQPQEPARQPESDGPGWGAAAAGGGVAAGAAGAAAYAHAHRSEPDAPVEPEPQAPQPEPQAPAWGQQPPEQHQPEPQAPQPEPQAPDQSGWGVAGAGAAGVGVAGVGVAGGAAYAGGQQDTEQPAPPEAPGWGQPPEQPAAGESSEPVPAGDEAEELPTQVTPAVAEPPTGEEPADEALTIGRGRTNSIVLDDMLVSRQHVRITVDDEGLVIEDLESRNGTFVNGRRIERTHLHEGDRIGIGASTFEVRDGWLVSI